MKRVLSITGNLLVYAIIALGVLAVIRPELIPFSDLRGDHRDVSEETNESSSSPLLPELVDDGWDAAHETLDPAGHRAQMHIVRLDAPGLAERIGLETAIAEERSIIEQVEGAAETTFDGHRFAEIVPRVACLVREVLADHGTLCQPGDRLAVVDAAEVGTAKATYLSALATTKLAEETMKRTSSLSSHDALPKARELEARAALNTARADLLGAAQRLRNLGFTDEALSQIAEREDTSSLLDIVAPIAGTVVELHAVIGEALEPTTEMFQVTDLSALWAYIDVPESDFDQVRQGQQVTFSTSDGGEPLAEGIVEWVDVAINPVTRTVRVLAELQNPEGKLRANQFGWSSIAVAEPRSAVVVPRGAVQDFAPGIGLVFLAGEGGSYRPQRVEVRSIGYPDLVEIAWGLRPGDEVVTTGAFFLMSELRRDELAGD